MEKNLNRVIGVCEIWYVLQEDVESVDVTGYDKVDITLKAGVEWEQIPFTPGTAKISEHAKRKEAGKCYEQTFIADIPGEDEDMTSWSLEHDTRPVVMKVVQSNGTKIYGDLVYPVRLLSEWNTDNHSTTIRFSRDAKERARWMNEEFSGSGS